MFLHDFGGQNSRVLAWDRCRVRSDGALARREPTSRGIRRIGLVAQRGLDMMRPMLVGTKCKIRPRAGQLSRVGALWILVAAAGCASEAQFAASDQGVESAAWESIVTTEVEAQRIAGVSAAVELLDATGNDLGFGTTGGTPSDSSSSHDNGDTCLLPSGIGSSTKSTSASLTSTSADRTSSTVVGTTSATSAATTSSSAQTATTTSSQLMSSGATSSSSTEPDDTSETNSAGASELCGAMPFDAAWLRQKLSEFTGAAPTSVLGAPGNFLGERASANGRGEARAWLAEQYSRLGYQLDGHDYPGGTNVFAERKGTGEGVLLISSHYDTVVGSVGADDDASGVIVGLAVAAAMARCQPEKTVRIIAFDQEENGMVGSRAYVRSLRDSGQAQDIAGVIQIEMAGYDQNNDGFINRVDCGHTNNRFIVDALSATISNENIDLTAFGECQGRSDHVSFWDANIPAITISELFFGGRAERNPCYHQSCDTVANLNFDFMNKIARAVTLTTIALSEAR